MRYLTMLTLLLLALTIALPAQERGERRARFREKMLKRFDRDGDGKLSEAERAEGRKVLQRWRRRSQESQPDQELTLSGLYGQNAPEVALLRRDLVLRSPERGEELEVRLTVPEAPGRYPVIVWSHGLFGSDSNYRPLVDHWARHGYLVLQATHSDSLRYANTEEHSLLHSLQGWEDRPLDIKLILDALRSERILRDRADPGRIGMGGHSFGAHTTLLVNGARPRNGADLSDPRPKAFVAISPQGEGKVFSSDSWAGLRRPMLVISGDRDQSAFGETIESRRIAFDKCPAGEKYLFWIKDAEHNFGGISGARRRNAGPLIPDQVELVRAATLAFWDKYLKGDSKAATLVDGEALAEDSQGLASWTRR